MRTTGPHPSLLRDGAVQRSALPARPNETLNLANNCPDADRANQMGGDGCATSRYGWRGSV